MNRTRKIALLTLLYWVKEGKINLKPLGFTEADLQELEIFRKQLKRDKTNY